MAPNASGSDAPYAMSGGATQGVTATRRCVQFARYNHGAGSETAGAMRTGESCMNANVAGSCQR